MTNKYYDSILNFLNPGGESKAISPLNNTLRVSIKLEQGALFNDSSQVRGIILNNTFVSGGVFSSSCFETDCFESDGIITTAYPLHEGKDYFVQASIDIEGNGWILQMGTICQATGEFHKSLYWTSCLF